MSYVDSVSTYVSGQSATYTVTLYLHGVTSGDLIVAGANQGLDFAAGVEINGNSGSNITGGYYNWEYEERAWTATSSGTIAITFEQDYNGMTWSACASAWHKDSGSPSISQVSYSSFVPTPNSGGNWSASTSGTPGTGTMIYFECIACNPGVTFGCQFTGTATTALVPIMDPTVLSTGPSADTAVGVYYGTIPSTASAIEGIWYPSPPHASVCYMQCYEIT